jgi:hypothetical protein
MRSCRHGALSDKLLLLLWRLLTAGLLLQHPIDRTLKATVRGDLCVWVCGMCACMHAGMQLTNHSRERR